MPARAAHEGLACGDSEAEGEENLSLMPLTTLTTLITKEGARLGRSHTFVDEGALDTRPV